MSEKHFTLDIDPEGLRAVATKLGTMAETLGTQAGLVSGTPAEIDNRWTGTAATDIQAEMTALGNHLSTFQTSMGALPEALRSLAQDYDDALERLPGLNQKWEQAEQDYQDAVTAAGNALTQGREDAAGEDGTVDAADNADLQQTRDNAVAAAADTRQSTQHNLELDFGYMKQWLGQQTRTLGTAMRDSGPLPVTDSQIEAWRNGEAPQIDRSPLFDSLVLSRQREIELVTPEVEEQVQALQDALEDGDQEAVNDALDAIAAHADDPIWSEALARTLGPEGLQDLYLQIDERLSNGDLYIEEIWPHLSGFNETVANGVSQLPDDDFADYLETWMQQDYGPKMWALLASADSADGRINAAAMAYQSEVYNSSLTSIDGYSGLFPEVFHYAYDGEDMLDQWDDRASGSDLADILEHGSDELVQDLMQRLHNVQVDGGTMNEDEWEHLRQLYGELVVELKDRFMNQLQTDGAAEPDLLRRILEFRHTNAGRWPYDDFDPWLQDLVDDPAFTTWWILNGDQGRVPLTELRDLIEESGGDVEEVLGEAIAYHLSQGNSAESAAVIIGNLLRTEDLLDNDINWNGVLKSLVGSAIGLGAKTPLTGPAVGAATALINAIEEAERNDEAWDSSKQQNGAEAVLAVMLYQQAHGDLPHYQDFLDSTNVSPDNEDAFLLYVQYMQSQHEDSDAWAELRILLDTIDTSRNS